MHICISISPDMGDHPEHDNNTRYFSKLGPPRTAGSMYVTNLLVHGGSKLDFDMHISRQVQAPLRLCYDTSDVFSNNGTPKPRLSQYKV